MLTKRGHRARSGAVRVWCLQLLFALLLAAILGFTVGFSAGYSALLGGLASVLPNGFFIYRFFRDSGAQEVRKVLKSFYLSELGKWALTLSLFGISLRWFHATPGYLLLAFTLSCLFFILAPWLFSVQL